MHSYFAYLRVLIRRLYTHVLVVILKTCVNVNVGRQVITQQLKQFLKTLKLSVYIV